MKIVLKAICPSPNSVNSGSLNVLFQNSITYGFSQFISKNFVASLNSYPYAIAVHTATKQS